MNGEIVKKPRLLVVGPLAGRGKEALPTQGEFLARMFAREGYPVQCISTHPNRYIRLFDIAAHLLRNRHRIDVQIHQVFSGPSFYIEDLASRIGARSESRIIMVLRGGDLPRLARRNPSWVRRVLGRADVIVSPSPFLVRELSFLDLPMRTIPNVIDLSQYPYQKRTVLKPNLLWMRSFHWYYNPALALRTLRILVEKAPEARLVMAGPDKGLLQETESAAAEMGLASRVTFPGFLDADAKRAWAERQDIYLNTNRVDNTPISVLEMAAMGLPVVATAVGGVPDLLTDGVNALLVPDDDPEAMAGAVLRLLDDAHLSGGLSEAGRLLAESCSWGNVYPAWQEILN